jgi:hypothetical protein
VAKLILVVNSLVIIVFAVVGAYIQVLQPVRANAHVVELDRNEVIDHEKLMKYDSYLGEDPRGRLGEWVARDALWWGTRVSVAGASVSILNIVLMWLCRKRCAKLSITDNSCSPDKAEVDVDQA